MLTPLNFLFSQWKKLVSRFFKTNDDAKMSHEELLLFMEDVEQDGGIDENEGELLRNALEFRDLTAAEILTHRIELEAVDIGESHEEIARVFTQSRFSRLLVYRDTIDQIVGVLHQKDFYINGKMTDQPITASVFYTSTTKLPCNIDHSFQFLLRQLGKLRRTAPGVGNVGYGHIRFPDHPLVSPGDSIAGRYRFQSLRIERFQRLICRPFFLCSWHLGQNDTVGDVRILFLQHPQRVQNLLPFQNINNFL